MLKKLLIIASVIALSACSKPAEYNKADPDEKIGTKTHHCQQVSDTKSHCVNWVGGKYNSHYHENCNKITCEGKEVDKALAAQKAEEAAAQKKQAWKDAQELEKSKVAKAPVEKPAPKEVIVEEPVETAEIASAEETETSEVAQPAQEAKPGWWKRQYQKVFPKK
ncbi:MAG: hypothetical protein FWF97_00080 [Alphaproteobacteria bacterium]|nr:hypothetical protein [Alphaproteobacteria bacterium]